MQLQVSVSPGFPPERIAGWHIFNIWLQKALSIESRFISYHNRQQLHLAIENNGIDLIYANSFDAAQLLNEHGFIPIAGPAGAADEVLIASRCEAGTNPLEALGNDASEGQPINIASTEEQGLEAIAQTLLSPYKIELHNANKIKCSSHLEIARSLLRNEAQIGLFLASAYQQLPDTSRQLLNPIAHSQLQLLEHSLLLHPKWQAQHSAISSTVLSMHQDPSGEALLEDLGIHKWKSLSAEAMSDKVEAMSKLLRVRVHSLQKNRELSDCY